MPITIDEVVESAARGVLRAMDARDQGLEKQKAQSSASDLIRAGFYVDFNIRAGGRLDLAALNPQPLPPIAPGRSHE